jgi:hypothetical protein
MLHSIESPGQRQANAAPPARRVGISGHQGPRSIVGRWGPQGSSRLLAPDAADRFIINYLITAVDKSHPASFRKSWISSPHERRWRRETASSRAVRNLGAPRLLKRLLRVLRVRKFPTHNRETMRLQVRRHADTIAFHAGGMRLSMKKGT